MEKKHWQLAEREKTEAQRLEASARPADKSAFASVDDDRRREEDDQIVKEDWGDVDPQPDTGRDPMDPSGPGSAV